MLEVRVNYDTLSIWFCCLQVGASEEASKGKKLAPNFSS